MRSLGDTQALFRTAIAGGPAELLAPLLRAPADPLGRLEIYRRHHRETFRRHLRGRYPTMEWLLGTDAMIELADSLLRVAPPRAPSLAEFGAGLIDIIAGERPRFPAWLADVARLDWHLGCLSVAVEHSPIEVHELATLPHDLLLKSVMTLQSGVVLLQSDWPVDDLLHLRLGGNPPEALEFTRAHVHLELRGARGHFAVQRLSAGDYALRKALLDGRPFSVAAERALSSAPDFDLGAAIARLFAERLVTSISSPRETNHV
jgi:hypothetical protein